MFQPVSDCVSEHVFQLRGAEEEALRRAGGEILTADLSLLPETETGHVTLTFTYSTNTREDIQWASRLYKYVFDT